MTSVTISERLRRRLKQLAAKFDTTQGKIIEMALELMDQKENITKEVYKKDNEVEHILKEISQELRNKNPNIKKRRSILEKEGISIDDVIGYTWGFSFEDNSRQ